MSDTKAIKKTFRRVNGWLYTDDPKVPAHSKKYWKDRGMTVKSSVKEPHAQFVGGHFKVNFYTQEQVQPFKRPKCDRCGRREKLPYEYGSSESGNYTTLKICELCHQQAAASKFGRLWLMGRYYVRIDDIPF